MINISLDLETWGKRAGCDIRSIGACVFTKDGIFAGEQFYLATMSGERFGLTKDQSTIDWWETQSIEAQSAFENPVELRKALQLFQLWMFLNSGTKKTFEDWIVDPEDTIRLWVNGPQFDIAILDYILDATDHQTPWHYRAPRDLRTIVDVANFTRDDYCSYGNAHNALDDACAQALTIGKAMIKTGMK